MTATTKTHTPATTTVRRGKRKPPAGAWTYERRDGSRRLVAVGVDVTGVWFVYDVPTVGGERTALVVERLPGFDDKLRQATALAAEYLCCQREFHLGLREEFTCPDPLPKPRRIALRLVALQRARALAAAAHADQLHPAAATGTASDAQNNNDGSRPQGSPPGRRRRERTNQ
ncbi:MAG TPA: hypothetical protein VGY76_10595 [Solirubrobacteraceae bacterium]|jgi:hypothetical protein|nr:hypothetical protein [Solirubrobacteraceae bacterium]